MEFTTLVHEEITECQAFLDITQQEADGETIRYYSQGGDFWFCDPDYVIVDGKKLSFGYRDDNPNDRAFILLDFMPEDYPEHIALIKKWIAAYQKQRDWSKPNPEFERADLLDEKCLFMKMSAAIAYRGGSGYSYGIYRAL